MRRLLLTLIALFAVAAHAPAALAQTGTPQAAAQSALAWMRAQQQPDGSFPGFGPGETADAIVAIVAAGEPLAGFAKGESTPVTYLQGQAATYAASGPGGAAKLVMAAIAAGADPTAFGGVNLLEQIGKSYDAATGQYGPDVYGHALALLALSAVEAPIPNAAIGRLTELQLEDGGWSFDGSQETGSDTNTTSLVIQAVAGQRQADGIRASAAAYLKTQQNEDGGFPYSQTSQFGNASDANSTAAVIQAIVALGQDPAGADWTKGGNTPIAALLGLQNASGAFRYQAAMADDNALATYQAVPALLGKALPVARTAVPGAQDLVTPAAPAAPAAEAPATPAAPAAPAAEAPATPAAPQTPAALPATSEPTEAPVAALALAALALAGAGLALRRRGAL